MRPAVAYLRVSTDDQTEGVSLDAQEAKVRAWATLYEYELVRVFQDAGISGRTTRKRPDVQAAIKEACRLHCPLVFYSLSRFSRNLREAIEMLELLEKNGASLASVVQRYDTSTVTGWIAFVMEAFLAELEVRQISERTSHALQFIKSNGGRAGQVPYGYDVDESKPVTRTRRGKEEVRYPHLLVNSAEQAVLALIQDAYRAMESYNGVARELNERGIPSKNGGKWHAQTVKGVLKRPL